jgi:hypothetical protein
MFSDNTSPDISSSIFFASFFDDSSPKNIIKKTDNSLSGKFSPAQFFALLNKFFGRQFIRFAYKILGRRIFRSALKKRRKLYGGELSR